MPDLPFSSSFCAVYAPSFSSPSSVGSYSSASRDSSKSERRELVPPMRSRSVRRSHLPTLGS